jgi:(1->4)-alpha-D-glucan 1-alpha-D-glucosylmutase
MQAYAVKALREGKQETSWHNPNEAYEAATTAFLARLLDRAESAPFLESFEEFAARTRLLGALNSLVQLVLKATVPGVPDFYQGAEFWDLSLVDPDNRRPVDFAARRGALVTLATAGAPDWGGLLARHPDGLVKFALTRRLLALRGEMRELVTNGHYEPIEADGPQARHVVAFARTLRRQALIVAVGRHFAPLTNGGRRLPASFDLSATLNLDRFTVVDDRLTPGAPAPRGGPQAKLAFGALPIMLLRAVRRR